MSFLAGYAVAQTELAGIQPTAAPPAATIYPVFSKFPDIGRKTLAAAVIAATGVISTPFIPAPVAATSIAWAAPFSQPLPKKQIQVIAPTQVSFRATQSYVFGQFDQPQFLKQRRLDADTQSWLEQEPPAVTPLGFYPPFDQPQRFTRQFIADEAVWLEQEPPSQTIWGFISEFTQPLRKQNLASQINWAFSPFIAPATFDPFVKWPDLRKKKRKKPEWQIIDEERAERRKAIELAVYGPPVEYRWNPLVAPQPPAPINTDEVMQAIMNALEMAEQKRIEEEAADEEAIIELMLQDEQ